jgi:hypothetical protein
MNFLTSTVLIVDTFFNGSNGCTVQAYNNLANGACKGTLATLTVTAQTRCINVQ